MGLVPPLAGTNSVDGTIFWYICGTRKVMVNGLYPERCCTAVILKQSRVNGELIN